MLSSFSGMLSKLKQNKLVQNLTNNYNLIKKQINSKMQILEITPNIYHISYPEQSSIKELKEHIGDHEFQIWNISEYKYDSAIEKKILEHSENGEIHHLCYEYYSNLPLYELIIAINSIHYFTALSPNHRVYIHCQDNKIRSSVFLICFIYKFKVLNLQEISEAILYVNQKLNVKIEMEQHKDTQTAHYNNFHTFFKNFINYVNNPQIINKSKLELLKILINDAPQLKLPTDVSRNTSALKDLKVALQIRCKEEVVLKSTYDSKVFEGESICIELRTKTIILGDDFLVIIKYSFEGKVYSMMRIQYNTNFVFEKFFRAHQQYIDLSAYCQVKRGGGMFIDFMFEQNLERSDLAKLQDIPQHQTLKIHKKHQQKQRGGQSPEVESKASSSTEVSHEHFSLNENESEEEAEVDEQEMDRKIEEMLKNLNSKKNQEEEEELIEQDIEQQNIKNEDIVKNKETENEKKEQEEQEEEEEEEEDLDDYLSKLESQA